MNNFDGNLKLQYFILYISNTEQFVFVKYVQIKYFLYLFFEQLASYLDFKGEGMKVNIFMSVR